MTGGIDMAAMRDVSEGPGAGVSADEATELARRHLVQPWPYAGLIGTESRGYIGKGDGVYIWDGEGRRLLDGPGGMWCVNVGHRREELAAVMHDQAMELSYSSPWTTM